MAVAAGAAAARAQSPGDVQRRLEQGRQALVDRQKAEKGILADVSELQAERERLNQSLLETARQIQESEALLTASEARLGELEAQERIVRGSLAQQHEKIAKLLAVMQRMGRNPPPVLVTRREDALRMVRSAMTLAAAFPELRTQALALAERLGELTRIMDEAKGANERIKAETARLADSRTRLAELMESKRQSLVERQAELDRVRRETAEIAKNVNDLSELIQRLDRMPRTPPPAPPAERAAPPAESQAAAAPPVAVPPPAAPPPAALPPPSSPRPPEAVARAEPPPVPVAPAAPPPPPPAAQSQPAPPAEPPALRPAEKAPQVAIEIAPKGQGPSREFGRMEPSTPFAQAKGRLSLPAQGRRVLAFGDRTQYGSQSKGIVLETRYGAQVTAPADGWVIFAGEFRTFGQLLIIDGGGGYHILLAGLSQIDVQPRQFVLAGEPVGVMQGPPRAVVPKAADSAPVLYIEFRKDNKPIDPDPWWLPEGQRKVQG